MGGDVAGARDDGMDVVNLMHGRDDVEGMEVRVVLFGTRVMSFKSNGRL